MPHPRPRLHFIDLVEYQELALSDDGTFDAHETLEVCGAFISIGHHRVIGPCILACLGPDGGFVAELKNLPAPRTGDAA